MKARLFLVSFFLFHASIVTGISVDVRADYQLQVPNIDEYSLLWHGVNSSAQVFLSDFFYIHMGGELFNTGQGEKLIETDSPYFIRSNYGATVFEPGIGIGADITDRIGIRVYAGLALASFQYRSIIFESDDGTVIPSNTESINETRQSFGWLTGFSFDIRLFEIQQINMDFGLTLGLSNLYLKLPPVSGVDFHTVETDFGGYRVTAGVVVKIRPEILNRRIKYYCYAPRL